MKKVFAILSTLLLTIAFVGVSVKSPAKAADGKFTVDTTLADDEIPVYIMDSIMTTFPNYYDNDANPDPKWQGVARMYPWNETRLRVAQLDANGQPTGKYYAVYFAGHTVAKEANGELVIGAGKNILFYDYKYQRNDTGTKYLLDENGDRIPVLDGSGNKIIEAVKYSDGILAKGGQASDPSLSHMRKNISGETLIFDPTKIDLAADEGANFYNRAIIFDGQGRVIRGIALDDVYTSAPGAEGQVKFAPEYCRVDGVVTKIEDGVVCDKAKVELLDENGETVMDENGNPVLVDGENDDLIYSRFVWEFFEEKPTNVNTVPYLSEGWDAMLWDYCYPVEGGYMAIAFVGSADNTAHVVKGDQVEPYKQTLIARYIAQGMDKAEAETKAAAETTVPRACVKELRIPAGGFTFDYGYLDKGKATNDLFFNSTVINGYLYGRQMLDKKDRNGEVVVDSEGKAVKIGLAEQRTYNFSVSDIKFDEKVIDGNSYRLVNLATNTMNVVEIMQGDVYNPTNNINYNGVMRYWGVENDLTSYTASSEALELYINESFNGGSSLTAVEPSNDYTSMEAIIEDFFADIAAWKKIDVSEIKFDSAADFQGNFSWGQFMATNADNAAKPDYPSAEIPSFWNVPKHKEKWSWLLEKIYQTMLAYPGGDTYDGSLGHIETAMKSYYCGSPQTLAYAFWYFFKGQTHGYMGLNFGDGHNTEWIDPRTNLDKWNDYKLDASTKAAGDNWVVNYKVVNSQTGVDSKLTVKYVVVDSYTPIITLDSTKLRYIPKQIGDSFVCDPIDPYQIVKAYDAQYNGVSILGNDISQNIVFDTDLDFNNPEQGQYDVVATITNNAGTKKASVKFVITVNDVTAPLVITRNVTVQQGENFDPRDGLAVVYDNVDGNLKDATYEWWYQTTPVDPIDTTKVSNNKNRTYDIVVEVSDRSGNTTYANYQLVVVADTYNDKTVDGLSKDLSSLKSKMEEALDLLDLIKETVDGLNNKVDALTTDLNATKTSIDQVKSSVDDVKTTVNDVKKTTDTTKTDVEAIKGAIEEVQDSADGIKNTIDAVKATSDSTKAVVDTLKANAESDKGGCKSGALIALGLSTLVAVAAVVLKKKH